MDKWFDVLLAKELHPGDHKDFIVDNIDILILNIDGKFFAVENLCTHDGGDLSAGQIEDDEIICPRHGARFCIKTGEATTPPAYEDIDTFPVREKDGMLQVLIDQ